MTRKAVYVVACETLSALGFGSEALKISLRENYCAVEPIAQFCPEGLTQQHACEVKQEMLSGFQFKESMWHDTALHDRKFELWAALLERYQSTITETFSQFPKNRTGIVMGLGANAFPVQGIALQVKEPSASGLYKAIELINQVNTQKGNTIFNHADLYAHYLQELVGPVGYSKNILTACSSSTQAIAFAAARIMADEADFMFVGGTDSILNQFAYISFGKLGVLTEQQCRPFDVNRSGAIAGECAGFTVLVSEEGLKRLNKREKFQLLGYGNSLDAFKITAPDPTGHGVETAIRKSLEMADIQLENLDYINAHGTGTRSNDEVELRAIERVVGDAAEKIHVSSTKDRHGHCIAAAGILEFNVLLCSMEMGIVPANLNLEKPIPTPLLLPQHENHEKNIHIALTTNFAFGGVNCSLAVKNLSI